MSLVLSYRYPCVVEDPGNSSAVVVVGVTSNSTIQVSRVDISDINNPKGELLRALHNTTWWSPTSEKACLHYPRLPSATEPPRFYMRQFGMWNYMTDILVDGTVLMPYPMFPLLSSPRLYSITGAYQNRTWTTAHSTTESTMTGNPWVANDITPRGDQNIVSPRLQQKPTSDAMLSVGTFFPASTMPVFGYLTVFDATGSKGLAYMVISSHQGIDSPTDIQALAAPQEVNMGGVILTKSAFSVTMGATAYIVDEAPDKSTLLYSISPNSTRTPTLLLVTANSNVPTFMQNRAITTMGTSGLLLFGGVQNGTPTNIIHTFDIPSGTWAGPNLVAPYVPESSTGRTSTTAIIGGIVGGVVLLALVLFFVYRNYRQRRHSVVISNAENDPFQDPQAVVLTDTTYQTQSHSQPGSQPYQYHHHHQRLSASTLYDPTAPLSEAEQLKQPLMHHNGKETIVHTREQGASPRENATHPRSNGAHPREAFAHPQEITFQETVIHPQATVYIPQVSAIHRASSTPSSLAGCSGYSPTLNSADLHTERGSSLSAETMQSLQVYLALQPGAPQSLPESNKEGSSRNML
ncbi:hypothetical protein BGZ73_002301 [Actinomortierella ambigua]|nr:hypothetical protein BGZ73_002301 [Actinomortierella ambigua]